MSDLQVASSEIRRPGLGLDPHVLPSALPFMEAPETQNLTENVITNQPKASFIDEDAESTEETRKKRQREEECCCYMEPELDAFDWYFLCRCIVSICRCIGECTDQCCTDCAECLHSCCENDCDCGGGCCDNEGGGDAVGDAGGVGDCIDCCTCLCDCPSD